MSKRFSFTATLTLQLAAACCVAAMLAGWPGVSLAADKPNFGGNWDFNKDQSDDASAKIREAQLNSAQARRTSGGGFPDGGYPGGGPGGGGYPGGGGTGRRGSGGGGRGPTGGGGMGRPGGGASQAAGMTGEDMQALATDPKILRIEQNEQRISISDDSGITKTLYPDGKKHKEQGSSGNTTAIKTHWDGDQLVAESKWGHSGKLAETYKLGTDGKHLYVTSRLDNSRLGPLTIRRVYDRAT